MEKRPREHEYFPLENKIEPTFGEGRLPVNVPLKQLFVVKIDKKELQAIRQKARQIPKAELMESDYYAKQWVRYINDDHIWAPNTKLADDFQVQQISRDPKRLLIAARKGYVLKSIADLMEQRAFEKIEEYYQRQVRLQKYRKKPK